LADPDTLIFGEPGTGRETVARELHRSSARRAGPFVAADCGALPGELLESELFGHEKGAFPGAITAHEGRIALAEGGTLFLDRVAEMNLTAQARLLRLLQDRVYERVGSTVARAADVRILAATDRDLGDAADRGTFREELCRRLQAAQIRIPPLRERLAQLPARVEELARAAAAPGATPARFAPDALAALSRHPWPGNDRELAALVTRLAPVHAGGVVRAADLPDRFGGATEPAPSALAATAAPPAEVLREGFDLKAYMERIEVDLIRQALQRTGGVVAHAANTLGLRRTTLVEKLRKYGLDRAGVAGAANAEGR
jgi:sigma-54 specific flagellar transcriptional regulator A